MQYVDFCTENFSPVSLDHCVRWFSVSWIDLSATSNRWCWLQNAPSSQKIWFTVLSHLENILFIAIKNKTTLIMLPCGRPFSSLYLVEMKLAIFTCSVLLLRKF
ncbi:unnamed protein product [Meganyctiphanes norvegica]|uniref:Uncharacterized protein n=1 Tax=Meganyctiphanes norvegica TaxID=48144 RepID=A0AAV2S7T9_MEGNR